MKASVLTLLVAVAILSTVGEASAAQNDIKLKHSVDVLQFFDNHSWLTAPRKEKCWQVPWQKSCRIARNLVEFHKSRLVRLRQERWHTIPSTNDWQTAVALAQRVYPGTASWLLYISDREGGYGEFVMNHQGSGAGGWMQFMFDTWNKYAFGLVPRDTGIGAKADVAQRGFDVDPAIWDWHDPLGQALTAGYMRYTHRDGCHWCL